MSLERLLRNVCRQKLGVAKFMTKLSHIPMQIQKWIASLAHLFFLILGLIGISLMYINGNFGLGLTGIGSVPYEDTAEFNTQFNNDLNDIFLYMDYQTSSVPTARSTSRAGCSK